MKPKRTLETQQDMKALSNLNPALRWERGWVCPARAEKGYGWSSSNVPQQGKLGEKNLWKIAPHLSHPQGLFHLCVSPLAFLSSSQYYLYCHCSGLWQTPTWLLYVPHIYVINKRMLVSLTHS